MWKMQRVLPLAAALLLAAGAPASAQTPSGFQVGGQLSTLRLSDFDATNAGFGGRASFDVSRFVTFEGEINFFANDEFEVSSPGLNPDLAVEYKRRRLEGFFGPKVGVRYQRFGIFGKVRPGFSRLTHRGIGCVGTDCALAQMLLAIPEYKTEFAIDLGGVFEFYPTERTVARVDLGTTMIRHRSTAPPCNDCNSQNFSSRFGFGFRF